MLTSLKSSSSSSEDATVSETPPICLASSSASSSGAHHLRRLLFTAADFISQSNFTAAQNLLSILSLNSSPYGDSTQRLVHLFTQALSVRFNPTVEMNNTSSSMSMVFTSSVCKEQFLFRTKNNNSDFESCYYLWLNQLTPFIRFGHLTANQAILDATEMEDNGGVLHILDLDISQGLQWPPLMQALAERSSSSSSSTNPNNQQRTLSLRITGCGQDVTGLNRTGDRLTRFANSLGLEFQFHTLVIVEEDIAGLLLQIRLLALSAVQGETIAVNCVHFLYKFFNDDGDVMINHFLSAIKSLNPRIVTMVEREANHGDHSFLNRFSEAMDHYMGIFDSLEATLPPNSRERLTLEQRWFGKEILDIVATEEAERKQRHRRFEVWEEMMKRLGFVNVPIGSFAFSQAKLLLRLHYPSEGYKLHLLNHSLFLGWKNRLLFSVSSWK